MFSIFPAHGSQQLFLFLPPAKVTHQRKNKQRSAAEKSHLSEKVDFPTRCGGFFIPLRLK